MTDVDTRRPVLARLIRWFAVPIIIGWIALTVVVNMIAPQLEVVGERHAAPMAPMDAPSMKAMMRQGHNFKEFDSNSTVTIVLEGEHELGEAAHRFYDQIIAKLKKDPEHVQHIQDFWSDRLTAAGVQSADAKGAYVILNLAGEQGTTLANESVEAVRKVVASTQAPPGVQAYVTGSTAHSYDEYMIGNASMNKITLFTLAAIAIMLFLVYRSIGTTLIQLFMTLVELAVSRGVIAVLGNYGFIELAVFATALLTMLAIAAGTDYGIFLIGRYQEARTAGEDRETAYYTTFHAVSPVVLGSGLTIAGAAYCLSFTRLPWFTTMGLPVAIGMLVVVAAALTLGPAVLTVASRIGLLEPKKAHQGRLWRRLGTAVVRWPLPILAASAVAVLIGMIALPGYKTLYSERYYLPDSAPGNVGYAAAQRHFSEGRLNPDSLMIEADHDMRNPADMLVLDRVAKNVQRVPGIVMVQDITRPLGIPIEHSSIPFLMSMQSQTTMQNMAFLRERMNDILKMADEQQVSIDYLQRMYEISTRLANVAHETADDSAQTAAITDELRNHIADFEDVWRPVRSYFYWEKHCFDIPICWSIRSLFDGLDGIDQLDEKLHELTKDIGRTASLTHEVADLLPPMLASLRTTRALTLATHSTFQAMINQMEAMSNTGVVMGQSFDAARNDDFFYLPPEAFDNAEFQRGLKLFLSPDGRSARFFINHAGDPATPEGISRVDAERAAAQEGLKQSSLSTAKVYLGGTAATYKDMHDGNTYDLMITSVASLTLIFLIMLVLTRSLVAALVIVGTAASSIAASIGLSVLIWQDLFGIRLHFSVMLFSVIVLLAVGSDYNLLLVHRIRHEIHAGLKTGTIRAMAGTGAVVTSAGLVFAFTMAAMLGSDDRIVAQMGATIALGLLLDTLIVRTLLMPSIATLLGRWFWWPQIVHPRGIDNVNRASARSEGVNTRPIPVPQ
ncbi:MULTISPECIES: MMPL/RND family transporter [Mycobacterium]|uniref:Membrane protein n=1 Tax=Mycobacterium kiyosense TaxID=2871094 RepID=A0A9P3Q3T9_9MYCO|nr:MULTISPECIES: MMPL family transporter [Mycobacterium]BDE15782.1 membrane protein [Mycobacterium sp. 20KCMC460]GLB80825.1 membrane protein [Mycobacterium kiyosense]GLB87437.1 membrane protein [Mycobacterium kiyosense]GLB93305.1 membrane protein [Mycobacterium kiyosense]GLB99513.1 membrane protein [Mycobacterium kiyosense]